MKDDKLTLELTKFSILTPSLWGLLVEKTNSILFCVELMVAFLVVVSFNGSIIDNSEVQILKILIFILLALIPVMLWDYTFKISSGLAALSESLGFSETKKSFLKHLIDESNYVYILLVTIVIDVVNWLIIDNLYYFGFILFLQIFLVLGFTYYAKQDLKG